MPEKPGDSQADPEAGAAARADPARPSPEDSASAHPGPVDPACQWENVTEDGGLVCAFALDGRGGARPLDWAGIRDWQPGGPPLWVHLDRMAPGAQDWLRDESGLHPVAVAALLEEETRPRCVPIGGGLLLILRGVNLNPGPQADEMISVRLWTDGQRVISVRRYMMFAIRDLMEMLREGRGPASCHAVLVAAAAQLGQRMQQTIHDLAEGVDALEEQVIAAEEQADLRRELGEMRRRAITFKRYLAPQREALGRLASLAGMQLDEELMLGLREALDRCQRYVEELDEVREHAALVQDELVNQRGERMNRNMYVLTVVAAIMLPLGFITGLLGINVGGIPGAESDSGFIWVMGLLAILVGAQIVAFRVWRLF